MSHIDEQSKCKYINNCFFKQIIDHVNLEELASPDSRKTLRYAKSIVHQVLCTKYPEYLNCPLYQSFEKQDKTTQTTLF